MGLNLTQIKSSFKSRIKTGEWSSLLDYLLEQILHQI